MGLYINQDSKGNILPAINKTQALIADGAKRIARPLEFRPNLVCVVDNIFFEAAGYCYSEAEMEEFKSVTNRNTQWLEYEHAEKLAQ